MCEECYQFKCPSGCPNADLPKNIVKCQYCETELRSDGEVYIYEDVYFCDSACLEAYLLKKHILRIDYI